MELIKLSATDSTNLHLKKLCADREVKNGTIIWAEYQSEGRGRNERIWHSQEGKNLCISRLHLLNNFPVREQFTINCAVALACYNTLRNLGIPELSIKWPNDIMAGSRKLGGILIENIVKGKQISKVIVGIGLNVNQDSFPGLPHATSLKLLMGKDFSRMELLNNLVEELDTQFNEIAFKSRQLINAFEQQLYALNREAIFQLPEKELVTGIIRGIDPEGRLKIALADGLKTFNINEIRMVLVTDF